MNFNNIAVSYLSSKSVKTEEGFPMISNPGLKRKQHAISEHKNIRVFMQTIITQYNSNTWG